MLIPVVLCVTALLFLLLSLVPGDPARLILGNEATVEMIQAKRQELGLNDPLLIRLAHYLQKVFFKLDFGTSYYNSIPIISEIGSRLPRTLTISLFGMILTVFLGIPLGVNAAVHQDSIVDRLCMLIAMAGVSVPDFWLGMLMVLLFALALRWLPANGIGSFRNYIMPVLAVGLGSMAGLARNSRNSMLEVIRSDYVTTARAKGVNERNVIIKHALPNALIPVVTSMTTSFAGMLGGTIVIENIFSIPGMGQYLVTAINNRDYNVVQGCVVVLAVIFSIIMLLLDLAYAAIDPRIKSQFTGSRRVKQNDE
jgi:peptide/nickel transport system permease protein